jgi:hypothetical protein
MSPKFCRWSQTADAQRLLEEQRVVVVVVLDPRK